jgi:large subunit ribosomal protein L17
MGNRLGDNADMAMIELVDYNEIYSAGKKKKSSTRRRKKSGILKPGDTKIESNHIASESNDNVLVEKSDSSEPTVESINVSEESSLTPKPNSEDAVVVVEDDSITENTESFSKEK